MNIDFFRYLPLEIIIEIVSRLPIRTIVTCKSVCKTWRNLIQTRAFVDSHLSKSSSGVVTCRISRYFKIFEFVDELDLDHHNRHYIPVTEFCCNKFMESSQLEGSANGLLFLRSIINRNNLYICNPITREYIQLPYAGIFNSFSVLVTYGFGVCKMTGRYKVVRVLQECIRHPDTVDVVRIMKCVCHVHTIGTGIWRSIAPCAMLEHDCFSTAINGSLHWLVTDLQKGFKLISCFDLETEIFSTFSPPPLMGRSENRTEFLLVALGGYLCVCDNTCEHEIVIWLMKEYGDEKSWTRGFVVRKSPEFLRGNFELPNFVCPIKVFKNGDMLMAWFELYMVHYSLKTKAATRIDVFGPYEDDNDNFINVTAMLHNSSFLSLKSCFPMENVKLL
ncbi:hypothetical protein ABFS82_03G108200 [Erythranthe guttata]|nr:PREDICTED: F-box protein At3g07870-like [Erythranthe guttata]|eukprot:XP_012854723.1 PREDICTED: F-box protein At3g07870-like [Erythranthe guttata]